MKPSIKDGLLDELLKDYITTGVAGRYLQTVGDNTPWGADATPFRHAPQSK